MIHAIPRQFTDAELNQLTIEQTADGRYELRLGAQAILTTEGRHVVHHSYYLIDGIRLEASMHGQLDVSQAGLYGFFCTHHDVILPGNDGIPDHITDILHHHEGLFWRQPRADVRHQLHAWQCVREWLQSANYDLPMHVNQRDHGIDQFVVESYNALSSAQRAVTSYLFHQHTTSMLLPMMVAMVRATATMYAAGMCMTTLFPSATGIHSWSEYRQAHQHFLMGAHTAQEYLWLAVR
ncbi:MAG: hypothetical protein RI985_407 [Chloroflexota bacterium]|jgi:hypothetical protein